MNRLIASITVLVATALMVIGCAQAQPASSPAASSASSSNAAAASTAAVAKKVDFPNGRPIVWVVPADAGGSLDSSSRMVAPLLEKELGTSIQIVNKPGANSQVGLTELATSRADGYTVGVTPLPPLVTNYLDKDRKALYTLKDFAFLGAYFIHYTVLAVNADSPFKTVDDLVNAAKANPKQIKIGDSGQMGSGHFGTLGLQSSTGAQFAIVHFASTPPGLDALLGSHIDAQFMMQGEVLAHFKAGTVRVLAILAPQECELLPGVKTMESLGYKGIYSLPATVGISAQGGTPKEVVDILAGALKNATASGDIRKKLSDMGFTFKFYSPQEYSDLAVTTEKQLTPLVEQAKREIAAGQK